jgi:hypothetical protein
MSRTESGRGSVIAIVIGALMGMIGIALLIRTVQGPPRFPPADRAAFTQTCHEGGAGDGFCDCLLTHIESRVTIEEFRALDAQFRATRQMPRLFAEYVQGCIHQAGP